MAMPTTLCRSCNAEILWQDTDQGRRPFDLGTGRSHFETCTEKRSSPRRNGTTSVKNERQIAKLTVLKAAAHFLGALSQTHEDVKSEHVLKLADRWLAWVERED